MFAGGAGVDKTRRISVVVAGATGSTGRELVSQLVSHPDVGRVVALSRHPIPVNRWPAVFPNLHRADALRYLSVVPLDWQKVMADTSNIPASYVSHGVWSVEEEQRARQHYLRHWSAAHEHSNAADGEDAASFAQGARPLGYVKFQPAAPGDGAAASPPADEREAAAREGVSRRAALLESQRFLQLLLHNAFYRSIFSGHDVAINCIGTSHFLSSSQLLNVDYDLSLAFAKLVRLFNCMEHAETNDDEERLLVESTSQELGGALWGEIYTACYGGRPLPRTSQGPAAAASPSYATATAAAAGSGEAPADLSAGAVGGGEEPLSLLSLSEDDNVFVPLSDENKPAPEDLSWLRRRPGSGVTLRHFSQLSVRAASSRSPIAYLRAHGRRDRDLLTLFHRGEFTARGHASGTAVHIGARPHVHGGNGSWRAAARALLPRRGAARRGGRAGAAARGSPGGRDSVARQRAELLLRRDIVKIWEQANITIWRPGVLARDNMRLLEYAFSLVERPLDVRALAECVVDDIVESIYAPGRAGRVKVINGKSVARRVRIKTTEDGLDADDTQPSPHHLLMRKEGAVAVGVFLVLLGFVMRELDD